MPEYGVDHFGIYNGVMSPLQKMMFGAIAAMLVPFCLSLPIFVVAGVSDDASQFIAYGIAVVCFVAFIARNGPGVPEK